MRRASSLVVLIALGLLALPTTALGARTAGGDSETIVVVNGDVTVPRGETVDGIVVVNGRIVAFLAGLAILRAAALVPVVGFFVTLAAAAFGLGLIGAAIGAARAPQPVPAGTPDS